MKKLWRVPAAALVAVGLLTASAAAVSADDVCPPNFSQVPAPGEGSPTWADRNGDGIQCSKFTGSGQQILHYVFVDNHHAPDVTAPGVTDAGAPVQVDTDTGAIDS